MHPSTGAFLKGWSSLPDEMRLQILRYVLPAGKTYKEFDFRCWRFLWKEEEQDEFRALLYPLLSVAQLQNLALEAFYTQNITYIHYWRDREKILWPPSVVHHHIQSIRVCISQYSCSAPEFLCNLANGTSRFGRLRRVAIDLESSDVHKRRFQDVFAALDVLKFQTCLLEVTYDHITPNKWVDGYGFGTPCDKFEMPFLDKFFVRGKEENITVALERYFTHWGTGEKEYVDAWPELVDHSMPRSTRKIVSIKGITPTQGP
jgi:hypothetical protein